MSTENQTTRTKGRVSFLHRCLALFTSYPSSVEVIHQELLKVEQSNLALRRKCADLRAQLAAAQQSIDQLEAALRLRN